MHAMHEKKTGEPNETSVKDLQISRYNLYSLSSVDSVYTICRIDRAGEILPTQLETTA